MIKLSDACKREILYILDRKGNIFFKNTPKFSILTRVLY